MLSVEIQQYRLLHKVTLWVFPILYLTHIM